MSTMDRNQIDSVIRSLRRVNLQGSFFGQTVAIRFGLSESDVEALELLLDTGAATAGRLSELIGRDLSMWRADGAGSPGAAEAPRVGHATWKPPALQPTEPSGTRPAA